jgi:hypothetical protein
MRTYRVAINHRAGHLVIKHVEAANKLEAEAQVRSQYPAICLGRTSSVKPAAR